MKLGTVIRKTLPALASQARALLVLISIGIALLLVLQSVLMRGTAQTSELLTGDAALRTIELDASLPNNTPTQLTGAQLTKIETDTRVESVRPWLQVGIQAQDEHLPLTSSPVLWLTPRIAAIQPPLIDAETETELGENDVFLPDQLEDESLATLLGSNLTISYTVKTGANTGESQTRPVHVAGLYDSSLQGLDGPNAVYASPSLVFDLSTQREGGNVADFATTYAFPKFFVVVRDLKDVENVQRSLTSQGFAVSTLSRSDALPGVVQFLTVISAGVGLTLMVFSLGCGFSIGASLTRYRQREIGLYRALGWSRRRLCALYSAQLALLGLLAGLFGTIAGLVLSLTAGLLLQDSTVFGLSFSSSIALPSWPWAVLTLMAPMLGLLIGSVAPLRRAVWLDPDEALRSN